MIREEIQRLSEGNVADLLAATNNLDKWLDLRDLQKVLKIGNKNTQLKKMIALIWDSEVEILSKYVDPPDFPALAKYIIKSES